jgi:hypothetical protein
VALADDVMEILRGKKMRFAASLAMLSALILLNPALAQAPKLGQLEVKAYQKIPKTKVAVQLTSDSHLSRELRREVMVQLQKRGNEVGFSGGNVMRMDVSFIDLSSGGQAGNSYGSPSYRSSGSNPMPSLPDRPVFSLDKSAPQQSGATLRVSLTLYTVDGGKVLWTASGSCTTTGDIVQSSGESMIDAIFADADHSRIGDAGC